jgi:hypothetical protein
LFNERIKCFIRLLIYRLLFIIILMSLEKAGFRYSRDSVLRIQPKLEEIIAKNDMEKAFAYASNYSEPGFEISTIICGNGPDQLLAQGYTEYPLIKDSEEVRKVLALWPISKERTGKYLILLRKDINVDSTSPLKAYSFNVPQFPNPLTSVGVTTLREYLQWWTNELEVNELWENDYEETFNDAQVNMRFSWGQLHDPKSDRSF